MKKLLFAVALVLGAVTVSAQEVGNIWVGGSAGIWSYKVGDGDRETNYNIVPEVGYVLSEDLGLGVKLGYAKGTFNFAGEEFGDVKVFTINPFARYSFLKGDVGSLFVDGGVRYSNVNEDKEGVDDNANVFEVGFRPGVAINVTEKISVLGHFGFLGYQNIKQGDAKADAFGLDLDMTQFTVGVNIFF